jgi:hypothetical protein
VSSAPATSVDRSGTGGGVPEASEIRETHTGIVALVGHRVFKAKKAIVTDFLDFRTVQAREEACRREVRLNRRFAEDTYLGVAHLTDPLGLESEPVVLMRRHPDARRLATMLRHDAPLRPHLTAIAGVLAEFHAGADRSATIDAQATGAAIRARWRENLTALRSFDDAWLPARSVDEVEGLAMQFIDGRTGLFARRIGDGRVVDGHGDLIAEDVFCLPDGPVLLDCLEFDDRLRFVDGLDDAAFLVMDLEFLGRVDLGEHFLSEYRRLANDDAPMSLAHFFIAYRAIVRAKVDCIRAEQGESARGEDARRHLDLALRHLRAGVVRLVLVGGGPGTGKTTVGNAVGERLGIRVISSDDVRQDMRTSGELIGQSGDLDAGMYSPKQVDAVYATMMQRADHLLGSGQSIILDATWRHPQHRLHAREIATQRHCPIVELACTAPLDIASARIADRRDTTSDATVDIAAAIARHEHSWAEAHPLDTSRPLGDSVAEAHQLCCTAT